MWWKETLATLMWLLVLGLFGIGMLFMVARPVVAAGCPQCFGFSKAADGVYLESGMAPAAREHVLQVLGGAQRRLADFYGTAEHAPRMLVCQDADCYRHVGGMEGTGTGSVGDFAVVVSPRGLDPVLVATALSHAELMGRVGFWRMKAGAIPAWFDAGVAVLVSQDPAYLAPARPNRKDRCLTGPGGELPEQEDLWQARVQQFDYLNAAAACRVDLWMLGHGGPPAVTGLLAKVAAGQDFGALYR